MRSLIEPDPDSVDGDAFSTVPAGYQGTCEVTLWCRGDIETAVLLNESEANAVARYAVSVAGGGYARAQVDAAPDKLITHATWLDWISPDLEQIIRRKNFDLAAATHPQKEGRHMSDTQISLTPGIPKLPYEGSSGESCIFLLHDGSLAEGVIVTLEGEKKLVTYATTYGPQAAKAIVQPLADRVVAHTLCRGERGGVAARTATRGTGRGLLENTDHAQFDAFARAVLADLLAGTVTTEQVVGGLGHVFAALDDGNVGEVRNWLEQGRKFVRQSAK